MRYLGASVNVSGVASSWVWTQDEHDEIQVELLCGVADNPIVNLATFRIRFDNDGKPVLSIRHNDNLRIEEVKT